MKKAVIVAPWFGAQSGGAEIALLKIAQALQSVGYDLEAYTSSSLRPYEDWLTNSEPKPDEVYEGIPIRRFAVDERGFERYVRATQALQTPLKLTERTKRDFFKYGMTSSDLVDAVKALPEDVLIIGGPYYQAMVHNVVEALPNRVFIMPAFHDEVPFHFPAISDFIAKAKGILFLTDVEKRMAVRHHGHAFDRQKLEAPVLSLPYPDDSVASDSANDGFAHKLIGDYLLYVGRMDEGKNINQLMVWHHKTCEDAIRSGKQALPLLMAGRGVEQTFKSPHVRILGSVSDAEKAELISGATGLVNLSLNESFSFVLFEAWQRKVPVIVHGACDVMRYHIDQSGGGYCCNNSDEYGSAVQHLQRPDLNRVLGWNGLQYADRICSSDDFVSRLLTIVEDAA